MFCFYEWLPRRISVSKGKMVAPFSPTYPWGDVSIFSYLFHMCCWIWHSHQGPWFWLLPQIGPILWGTLRNILRRGGKWEVGGGRASSRHMLGRWGRECLHPSWKEEVCVYFWCKCHTPCSVKAAGSFLGEERARLFSGIKFPAAALRERQVSSKAASPVKPGILLEKRRSMLSPWITGRAQSPCSQWLSCHSILGIHSGKETERSKLANICKFTLERYQRDFLSRPRNGACPKGTITLGASFRIDTHLCMWNEASLGEWPQEWHGGLGLGNINWASWAWAESLINELLTYYENGREERR